MVVKGHTHTDAHVIPHFLYVERKRNCYFCKLLASLFKLLCNHDNNPLLPLHTMRVQNLCIVCSVRLNLYHAAFIDQLFSPFALWCKQTQMRPYYCYSRLINNLMTLGIGLSLCVVCTTVIYFLCGP